MLNKFIICVYLCASLAYSDLLIRDVTVIDVVTGTALQKRSILIRGNKIVEIAADIPVHPALQVVNGTGKFIIPGLWDMHVYLSQRDELPLYAAYGVTGVRNMGGDFDRVKGWRAEIDQHKLIGPHIESCGTPVDGFPSEDPQLPVRVVRSPNEARAVFDRLDNQGVDFISVLPRLPRDAYFALVERARKYYSAVGGDVPATVSVLEAIDARQRSIEHMSGILLACSTLEGKLREPRSLALERRDLEGFQAAEMAALQTFSHEKADNLFQRMALYETRSVPMLADFRASGCPKTLYDMLARVVLQMARNGVAIMPGTGKHSGEALHEELELLVAAGLTPAQALRSATLEPAKYLNADRSLGTVETGKIADLVLLDRDPLIDIRNTSQIVGVVVAGQYLDRGRSKQHFRQSSVQ
jgi:hypothetical protein